MLLEKIKRKEALVAVIGLGYIGLPLAVENAKAGYKVIGLDNQENRVHMVNSSISYIVDVDNEDLANAVNKGFLEATTDYSILKKVDCISICVPTPLDKYKQPNISYIEDSVREIVKYLHKDMLIILESTTYPGTTEEFLKPIFEATGLKCGIDFYLAYSPERVDPGNKRYNTKNTPKLVGGITKRCAEIASTFYGGILEGEIYVVSSPKIAEMGKILENTYRNINIALANEMAIICDKVGIDVWEVIDAAKTKPYGFEAFYPGPGLGGHCIPIDPFYLIWKVKEYGYHTRFIELAGEINDFMPDFVLDRIGKILNKEKKTLNGANVFVLGVTYKKDIKDLRESPALKIIEGLEKQGAWVEYHDPFMPTFHWKGKIYKSVGLTKERIKQKDLVLIITDHTNVDYEMVIESAKMVFDTRNVTKDLKNNRENIVKL